MSRWYRSPLALPVLILLTLAAGCGKSTKSTAPTTTTLDQTGADDIAMQTTFALDQLGKDMDGIGSTLAASPARARPAWALWDTTVTAGGLTYSVSENFYDAQNQVLPGYGPDAVTLVWMSSIMGSFADARDTATVGHHAVLRLTGIQPADTAFTLNGSASDSLLNDFRSYDGTRTRHFFWRSALTLADVVWGRSHPWPWSGTATYVVQADRLRSNDRVDVEAHLSARVVITFNGTSEPDVVINGTWHYKWDMQTGAMVRV